VRAGIIALASPKVGDAYLEEFSLANAEDVTEILSTTYSYGHDPVLDEGVPAEVARRRKLRRHRHHPRGGKHARGRPARQLQFR